jgi:hypothetical protein
MDTIQLPIELREFLKLLHEHHVDYLLIGGYAVGYYGYPLSICGVGATQRHVSQGTVGCSHTTEPAPYE